MKKIALLSSATLAIALTTVNALAATGSASSASGPNAGNIGLNIGLNRATAQGNINTPADLLINGKYFITKDMAIVAGVGLQSVDNGAATNSKSTDLGFQGGFRKYLKTDDLAPFVGGRLQYLSTRSMNCLSAAPCDVSDLSIGVEAGAEYFFTKQFSLEGSVGFGYSSADYKPVAGGASQKATGFGTSSFALSANFYL